MRQNLQTFQFSFPNGARNRGSLGFSSDLTGQRKELTLIDFQWLDTESSKLCGLIGTSRDGWGEAFSQMGRYEYGVLERDFDFPERLFPQVEPNALRNSSKSSNNSWIKLGAAAT